MSERNYWRSRLAAPSLGRRAFLRSAAVTGVGAAAFLAGCRSSAPSTPAGGTTGGGGGPATQIFVNPKAKRGGTLIHTGLDPTTGWDPHATISTNTGNVTEQMHIKLIRHDYTGIKQPWKSGSDELLIGELAEKWESPDPLTYNFTLRKGINWPDQEPMKGAPITAKDVKYSFDHAKLPSSLVQEYVFNNIKSVAAIDDHTVQFKTNYPHWRWLMDLDSYNTMVMPNGLHEWAGGTISPEKARGGGPWIVEDYRPGSLIIFRPNEAYRKVFGVPYADRLNFAILASGAPRLQAWIGKQSQVFAPDAGSLDAALKARPEAKQLLDDFAPTRTQALFMKTTEKPWDDVRMRRALSMSVDREGWGKTLRYEYKLESGPITWGYPDWKLDPAKMPADVGKWLKYDPAEATKLVQAAGSPSQVFEVHMHPYNNSYTPEAQFLEESMKKVGVNTKLKVYEYNNWLSTAYIGKYSGLLYGPDNLDRVTQQLADRLLANSSRNHSEVQDADVQKMLTDFANAKSPADAKVVSDKIQTRSVDQAWAVYSPQPVSPIIWDPALQNYDGQKAIYYQDSYQKTFQWLA